MLAGCGSGTLSHADYIKQADAVCTAFRAGATPVFLPRSYAEVVAYANKNLPLYEAALRKLEALKPPKQGAPQVRLWLAADRRVAAALRAIGDAGLRHDFPGISAATARLQAAGLESSRDANALGLQVCGRI